jgi:DNA-binding transcriptional MerR regulator
VHTLPDFACFLASSFRAQAKAYATPPPAMPYKERDIEKQYYTIGEVAAQFNVAPSLIRFWETEFEELRPRKSKKGNRLYTPQDIDTFRTIYHLVKERGYTIPGARDMLKQKGPQLKEKIDVIQSLERIRKFMVTMKKELDAIGKAQQQG